MARVGIAELLDRQVGTFLFRRAHIGQQFIEMFEVKKVPNTGHKIWAAGRSLLSIQHHVDVCVHLGRAGLIGQLTIGVADQPIGDHLGRQDRAG